MKRLLLTFLFLPFFSFAVFADEDGTTADTKRLSPYFWVQNAAPGTESLPLKSTRVEATVAGVIADVRVTQVYANTGKTAIEAIYVFPGSTRAAVHGLTMMLGERRIEAQIKTREKAREIYTAAKTEGKTASLLQQQRPNVFQMNVANILPGDEVRVELRYTELLVPTDGVYQFTYPGVVGPRYSNKPAGNASPDDAWVSNPYLRSQDGADAAGFTLDLTLKAGLPILEAYCRTHRTDITFDRTDSAHLSLSPEETNAANRDFIFRYRLAGQAIQTGLLLSESAGENFFLAMIQPPARPSAEAMPARDYLFIVDVSGSMHGYPIDTAKSLLRSLLPTLRAQDTFNILLFAGDSRTLAPASVPATRDNLTRALALLDRHEGGGSTELIPALKAALALPRVENTARTIAIITDGYVDVEDEAFSLIRSERGRGNVFAFGIGSSVNRHLIEGLARAGLGEPFIVTDQGEAEAAGARFRDYIASPVLTGVQFRADGLEVFSVEPGVLPDVYAQRPVVVFGKWKGPKQGKLTLTGSTGGQAFTTSLDVASATTLQDTDSLSHLWARSRIQQLSDDLTLKSSEETVAEITTLGLTYHLLTRFTSFVAVDEIVRRTPGGQLETVKQPLPLPHGVENSAVGGDIPTSPEPEVWALLIVSATVGGFIVWQRTRRAAA